MAMTILALAPLYAATALCRSPWTVGLAIFGFGFLTAVQNILIWSFRHESTPAPLIGRVSGITGSIFKLGMPFAIYGAGWLANVSGAGSVFVTCGIAQGLVLLPFLKSCVLKAR